MPKAVLPSKVMLQVAWPFMQTALTHRDGNLPVADAISDRSDTFREPRKTKTDWYKKQK